MQHRYQRKRLMNTLVCFRTQTRRYFRAWKCSTYLDPLPKPYFRGSTIMSLYNVESPRLSRHASRIPDQTPWLHNEPLPKKPDSLTITS